MADPTIFEYAVEDDQGLTNRAAMYMAYDGATTTVDSLIGSWLELGGLVDPCIDPRIVGGRITIPLEPDGGWKATAAVGNNVNQIMVLSLENDFNRYLTEFLLPGYKESILTPTRVPDVADAALAALLEFLTLGGGTIFPDIFPNSRDLHDIDALRSAFLTVRKVRNQRTKTRVTG